MTTKEIKALELQKGDFFIFKNTKDVIEIIAIDKKPNETLKLTFSDGTSLHVAKSEYIFVIDTEIEHGFDFDDIVNFTMTLDSQALNMLIGYYENSILDKFCSFSNNQVTDEDEKGYPKYIGLLYYIVSKFDISFLRPGQKEFVKMLINYYNDSTDTCKYQLNIEIPKFSSKVAEIEKILN